MSRLPTSPQAKLPPEAQTAYDKIVGSGSGLSTTLQSLFANPQLGVGLANLQTLVNKTGLEPWVIFTVALTVAHERDNQALWESFEPLARKAGVSNAVIEGIAAGTRRADCCPKKASGCTLPRRCYKTRCVIPPGRPQPTWLAMREPRRWPLPPATTI